jgi:hypothetical protein
MRSSHLSIHVILCRLALLALLSTIHDQLSTASAQGLGANWTRATSDAQWGGRFCFGTTVFNDQMWVMGGWNNSTHCQDVWSSTNGATWVRATSAAQWIGRANLQVVSFNGRMWVLGGQNNTQPLIYNDVWSSGDGTNWVRATSAAEWAGREDFGAVTFNGQMWVLGGQGSGAAYYNDVWSSSNGTNWLQATNAAPWKGRAYFAALVLNNQIWVLGGQTSSSSTNDVWSSSNGTNWVRVTSAAPWSPRYNFGAVAFNGQLWVLGGSPISGPSYTNDVWASSDGATWTRMTNSTSWGPRVGHGTATFNGEMWVLGGYSGSAFVSDVWFATNTAAASLTNMVITPVNPVIAVGSNVTFSATGYFSDGSTNVLTQAAGLVWSSGSPAVASIGANGVATGLTNGVTTITATSGTGSNSTLLSVIAGPGGSNTWYVWQDSPANGPGTAWSTAFHDIQSAIDMAGPGDTVLVTNGVYATGGRVVHGGLANRVAITKPLAVRSVNGPAVTLIQGDGPVGSDAVRCVYLTNCACLSGFTVTNGATGSVGDASQVSGGGAWGESASAILTNCSVMGNSAFGCGGGAYSATLINCEVKGNSINPQYGDNSRGGGGTAFCTLSNCTLTGNSGCCPNGAGGAMFCTLNNCKLLSNSGACDGSGGASFCTLNNCLLIGNNGLHGGGAGSCTLNNCTLLGNSSGTSGGAWGCTLNNCICYDNGGYNPNYDAGCTLNYCCTTPLPTNGAGNIIGPPIFVNEAGGDLHLQSGSPCINAGNNAAAVGATDLEGNLRIANGIVDLGAYEYQGPLAPPIITTSLTNMTVSSGDGVTLTVGVSGTPPFTYQWFCNGLPIGDATNATLTIASFGAANVGTYTVTVSNAAGSATSQPVMLASVDLQMFAGVVVNGPLGSNYLIQATPTVQTNWVTLTNLALPTQPYVFIDYSSPTNRQQFYRAVPAL